MENTTKQILRNLYNNDKSFKRLIDLAADELLTELVIDRSIPPETFNELFEITNDNVYLVCKNVLELVQENDTCPVCNGKLVFSGCPLLVCSNCKREFIIQADAALKLCDHCVANILHTCKFAKIFKDNSNTEDINKLKEIYL